MLAFFFLSVVVGTNGFGSKPWYAGIPACGSQYPSPVWMPAYHKKATTMQIHIGNLIRDELRRSGHTNQWLADRIGITPRTLQKLFNKSSIDTQQLLAICRALGVDLFHHYSNALATHVQSGHVSTSDTPRVK